ncbi:hypothetical protein [uncultured Desulfobacter sp.]|uniref:hypothetical protein n=1 Tax=uncultured Desulfobacter sp. TaxID=240139 RepID=UPI0029F50B97|nr:hypothetical protein [uncultured Desulfobacter sp.]
MSKQTNIAVFYDRTQVRKFLEDRFPTGKWNRITRKLPPVVWRKKWNTYAEKYGLPYKKSYIQNLDSKDIGPASY